MVAIDTATTNRLECMMKKLTILSLACAGLLICHAPSFSQSSNAKQAGNPPASSPPKTERKVEDFKKSDATSICLECGVVKPATKEETKKCDDACDTAGMPKSN